MQFDVEPRFLGRVAFAARVFTIAALAALAALAGPKFLVGAGLVAVAAAVAVALGYWSRLPHWMVALGEGCVVACVVVLTEPYQATVTPYLVIPVDDSEIKLPTDGFRAADTGQEVFFNYQHDGVSGATRPGPTAAGQAAPRPSVGAVEQGKAQAAADDKDRRKSAKIAANTDPVTPGFSLK